MPFYFSNLILQFALVETVTKLWRIKNEKGSVFNTLFRKV